MSDARRGQRVDDHEYRVFELLDADGPLFAITVTDGTGVKSSSGRLYAERSNGSFTEIMDPVRFFDEIWCAAYLEGRRAEKLEPSE